MKTVFQSFKKGNRDCGLACLEMLTGRDVEYWRKKLGINGTRNTKKVELLEHLGKRGFSVVGKGRLSGKTCLADLPDDALVFGWLDHGEDEFGHWTVWDSRTKTLRDPNAHRAAYRATSYTLLRLEK